MLNAYHITICLYAVATVLVAAGKLQYDIPAFEARPDLSKNTPRPYDETGLARRQTDGPRLTIGFNYGDPSSPVECDPGYTASIAPTPVPVFGCCNIQGSCNSFWNTCVDFGQTCSDTNDVDVCSSISEHVLTCSSGFSKCVSFMLKTVIDGPILATSYGCGPSSSTIAVLAATGVLSALESITASATQGSALETPVANTQSRISRTKYSTKEPITSSTPQTTTSSAPVHTPTSLKPSSKASKTPVLVPAIVVPIATAIFLAALWLWKKKTPRSRIVPKDRGRKQEDSLLAVKFSTFTGNKARGNSRVQNGHVYNNTNHYYAASPAHAPAREGNSSSILLLEQRFFGEGTIYLKRFSRQLSQSRMLMANSAVSKPVGGLLQ
ncbi:hypothetical protein AC578_1722 [Pseudocercospora eumusae]|uniref:Uncharacterized protein n=1 Tax=Pseudocercospora eumusae TaxID=321146 RepID=A0A139GZX3_9PEZI|nr:hypothetical protein AC578_1722 [Pseudocercospora eumusae]